MVVDRWVAPETIAGRPAPNEAPDTIRMLTLARAVAPLTARKSDGAGAGAAAIAAIMIKGPNMTVMVTD